MKKTLIIVALSLLALQVAFGQITPRQKPKIYYSIAWGLFKSKNYPSDKKKTENPKTSMGSHIDTTKYEQKSLLWGAIQWTEKKKYVSPKNNSNNEN